MIFKCKNYTSSTGIEKEKVQILRKMVCQQFKVKDTDKGVYVIKGKSRANVWRNVKGVSRVKGNPAMSHSSDEPEKLKNEHWSQQGGDIHICSMFQRFGAKHWVWGTH